MVVLFKVLTLKFVELLPDNSIESPERWTVSGVHIKGFIGNQHFLWSIGHKMMKNFGFVTYRQQKWLELVFCGVWVMA